MVRNLIACFLLFPVCLSAQDTVPLVRSFEIAYENDLLAIPVNGRTDYYYTGGSFIGFNLPALEKNPVAKILAGLPHGHNESFGITAANLGFTSTSIRSDSILYNDRPFCATLFLGLNRVSCSSEKMTRLSSGIDLGVIGPWAFGYESQKFIHAHTHNPEPHGWQFQVSNDVYINYSLKLEKGLLMRKAVEFAGYGFANAGSIYTNTGIGMLFRAGWMDPYFTSPKPAGRFRAWLYVRSEGKLVGRDATLQGGLFNANNVYVVSPGNVKRATLSASAGVVLGYKKMRFEWSNTFLTPEFRNGKNHMWGHLGLEFFF